MRLSSLVCILVIPGMLALGILSPFSAAADPPPPGVIWLDVEGVNDLTTEVPRAFLSPLAEAGEQRYLEVLGEVAFSAPEILGTLARRSGLSCQSCHVNGTVNPDLFIDGLSARKGGLDVTSDLFHATAEDGIANHRDVPSLQGISATPPYGRSGNFETLRDFTRYVIVDEFGGEEPTPHLLDALIAFQNRFGFPANSQLQANGDLTTASDAAHRGERLFRRPFPHAPKLSCASCHRGPNFTDSAQHDVGSGGVFDTPTLRGIATTAPYFHDGRAAALSDVVNHFDAFYRIGFDTSQRADLVTYLETIGAVEPPTAHVTLSTELQAIDRFRWLLGEAINNKRYEDAALAVIVARRRIGWLHERFDRDHQVIARQVLISWSRALQGAGRAVNAADPQAARFAFLAFTSAFWEMAPTVFEQSAGARINVQ